MTLRSCMINGISKLNHMPRIFYISLTYFYSSKLELSAVSAEIHDNEEGKETEVVFLAQLVGS